MDCPHREFAKDAASYQIPDDGGLRRTGASAHTGRTSQAANSAVEPIDHACTRGHALALGEFPLALRRTLRRLAQVELLSEQTQGPARLVGYGLNRAPWPLAEFFADGGGAGLEFALRACFALGVEAWGDGVPAFLHATSPRGSSQMVTRWMPVKEPRLCEIEPRLGLSFPHAASDVGDSPVGGSGDDKDNDDDDIHVATSRSAARRLAWAANTAEMMPSISAEVSLHCVTALYMEVSARDVAKYGKLSSETAGSLVAGFQSSIRSSKSMQSGYIRGT